MGCDGGSIPKRSELVKTKKRQREDADKTAASINEWFYCALSKEPLRPPLVSCALGKLYNKDAIYEFLLDRSCHGDGELICSHIRKPKDVITLKLTVNPARKTTEEPEKKSVDTLLPTAQFICPITMKEMNGKQRFCFMRPCGCVLSEQAVKEIVTGEKKCLHCQQVIYDFVPINPKGADLERLRLALAEKTRKLKKRKVDDLQAKETEVPTIAQDEQPAVKSSEEMQNDSIPKIISAKQSSAAIKSIYSSSSTGSAGKGNWLTKGTFTRCIFAKPTRDLRMPPQTITLAVFCSTCRRRDDEPALSPSRAYYCQHCHQIKCAECVRPEIMSYYCPACLFEVPASSATQEQCRCQRNCFQCPQCWQQLTIAAIDDSLDATSSTISPNDIEPQTAPTPSAHIMYCSHCRWDSLSALGWSFEKPIGLSSAYTRYLDRETGMSAQLSRLRQQRVDAATDPLPADAIRKRMSGNSSNLQQQTPAGSNINIVEPLNEDLADLEAFMQISSLQQARPSLDHLINHSLNSPGRIYPQQTHLRVKHLIRCQSCSHVLVKPDSKPSNIKLKMALLACDFIPTLKLLQQTDRGCLLQLVNPQLNPISIKNICLDDTVVISDTVNLDGHLLGLDEQQLSVDSAVIAASTKSRVLDCKDNQAILWISESGFNVIGMQLSCQSTDGSAESEIKYQYL